MEFFKVIIKKQSYLNILYLLLSFPLGIFYFIFLTLGFSLGLGLFITLIGMPILLGMIFCCFKLVSFEQNLYVALLKIKVKKRQESNVIANGMFNRFKMYFLDWYTWKSVGYLYLRFPLGIFSFIFVVTLISTSLGLICAPFLYHLRELGILSSRVQIIGLIPNVDLINSYQLAFITSIIGILLLFLSLNIFNLLVKYMGKTIKILNRKSNDK